MSSILNNVYKTETSLANSMFNGARDATNSNIIPQTGFNQKILNNNNTGRPQDDSRRESNETDFFISPLSGASIQKEAFHVNMVPFIKNKNQQNTSFNSYTNTLGRHTGSDENYRPRKQEVKSFFDITPNNSFVYGSPSFTETIGQDRYIPSQKRTNEKPFQDIRVGPGLAAGYTAEPIGGLTQSNTRDYVLPKSIDELRSLTNPNISYEGRIIAGLKSGQRGLQAKPVKHRPEKFYKSSPERGNQISAVKASQLREKYYMRPTQKENKISYYGGLGQAQYSKPRKEGAYRKSTKNNYMTPNPRNAYREDGWTINEDAIENNVGDYGKNSIENKANERDTTQDRIHLNNLSITVKKLITPITDFFRRTRKENFIGNIRPEGNMNAMMPSKQTVYDPNDIARTTIKEQTIDNDYDGALTGNKKHTVYDPNDSARTTIKEQTIDNEYEGAVTGNKKGKVYDPNDHTRTTIKEQTINNDYEGSLTGNKKHTVYDPNDSAKTTIKEQNIHNDYSGSLTGEKRNTVHDPNDIARTTIKEQNIHNNTPYVNMNPQQPRSVRIYDPEDIAKTTLKEVTIDNDHMGFVGGDIQTLKSGGYTSTSVDMKNTNRQFTTDWYYQGIADGETGTGTGRGYLAASYEAKNTNRQFLNDWEWEGPAKHYMNKPQSYDDMYNARMNPNREEISIGRAPTQESVKLGAGSDLVNIVHRRIEGDQINIREPAETFIYNAPPQKNNCGLTRVKSKLPEETLRQRINPDILKAFKENPYTQSLSSSVY